MTLPKVLVACPNHIVKEYSFQPWIDLVTNLTYPNYDVLVVDNSPNGALADKYGEQIPIITLDTTGIEDKITAIGFPTLTQLEAKTASAFTVLAARCYQDG